MRTPDTVDAFESNGGVVSRKDVGGLRGLKGSWPTVGRETDTSVLRLRKGEWTWTQILPRNVQ